MHSAFSSEGDDTESTDTQDEKCPRSLRYTRRHSGTLLDMDGPLQLPLQANTYDGVVMCAVLLKDHQYVSEKGLGTAVVQLCWMAMLSCVTIAGQFLLVYWLFLDQIKHWEDPYHEDRSMKDIIASALAHDPPVSLLNSTGAPAVARCQKDTTYPYSHLIVLTFWGTRMLQEFSMAAWRLNCLVRMPTPEQEGLLVRWGDGNEKIIAMPRLVKLLLVLFSSVPEAAIAILLAWAGGRMLMVSKGMAHMVLKAMTLQYIVAMDELVYMAFCSMRLKNIASTMKYELEYPAQSVAWQSWGAITVKLTGLIGYLLINIVIFADIRELRRLCRMYFWVFPEEVSATKHPYWVFGSFPKWLME